MEIGNLFLDKRVTEIAAMLLWKEARQENNDNNDKEKANHAGRKRPVIGNETRKNSNSYENNNKTDAHEYIFIRKNLYIIYWNAFTHTNILRWMFDFVRTFVAC